MNFRTIVFKNAWSMPRDAEFSSRLSQAWRVYRFKKQLHRGVVYFSYKKLDGTIRQASGTLQNIEQFIRGTGKENYSSVAYFDLEANGWRSFKPEFLLEY
jgi:hypothetical protein